MKSISATLFIFLSIVVLSNFSLIPHTNEVVQKEASSSSEISKLKFKNLLRDTLEIVDGVEVVLSYVEVPKETTLPYHFHPGEEFAYIIEGSGDLLLKDQSVQHIKAGEAGKVPLKHVHSFATTTEGARMVVFRVHEPGQPDRTLVE